jgi:hypothetical protein
MKRYLTNKYLIFSAKKIKLLNVKGQCDGWACFGEQSLIYICRKVRCAPLSCISPPPGVAPHNLRTTALTHAPLICVPLRRDNVTAAYLSASLPILSLRPGSGPAVL